MDMEMDVEFPFSFFIFLCNLFYIVPLLSWWTSTPNNVVSLFSLINLINAFPNLVVQFDSIKLVSAHVYIFDLWKTLSLMEDMVCYYVHEKYWS